MQETATVEERLLYLESELAQVKQLVKRGMNKLPVDSTVPAQAPENAITLGSTHPLAHLAGRLRGHPFLDTWRECVEHQRCELDKAEGME